MTGHVYISGIPLKLVSETSIVRSNANQAAAKIGQGAAEYDDLQNWSNWLQNDWRSGVGKKDPEAGGSLFSTLDSRFSNQLSLPGFVRHRTHEANFTLGFGASTVYHEAVDDVSSESTRSFVTIGIDQPITELGWMGELANLGYFEVYLPGVDFGCTAVEVNVWSVTAGVPDTIITTYQIQINGRPGWHWITIPGSGIAAGTPVTRLFSIVPVNGTVTLPVVKGAEAENWEFDGTDWSGNSTNGLMFRFHSNPNFVSSTAHITQFNGITYFSSGTELWKHVNGVTTAVNPGSLPAAITSLLSTGDRLYIGQGNANNYRHMNTAETFTAASVPAEKFLLWRGFLWRSVGANLFYTSDEAIWTLIEVADRGYRIRGLGGYGDDVIVSTDNALYRVTWGDLVQELTTWGAISANNGKVMHQFQGDLYISHGPSILRYDGNLLPVGPDLGEGLAEHHAGDIAAMASNNNWLLCAVNGAVPSIWIYNGQGWHFGGEMPTGDSIVGPNTHVSAMAYTKDDNIGFSEFVFMWAPGSLLYSLRIADTLTAMRRVTDAEDLGIQYHAWSGFLETDWFYGGLREVLKDFESTYLDGEHLGGGKENHCSIYWQDELSSDWELLGHVRQDETELRFTNEGRRPASRRLRLGLLLYNNFHLHTPVVTAIRVKYRPMITDRWRWQLPIEVKDELEMLDGSINSMTTTELATLLDQITKSVPPIRFKDIDDEEYEVMVLSSTRQPTSVRWIKDKSGGGRKQVHWVYNITVEQVHADSGFIGILAPTEVPDLWGWWDFSDSLSMYTTSAGGTNVSADGDPIGRVEDASGNGRHLLQANTTNRPVYKVGVQNNLSAGLWQSPTSRWMNTATAGDKVDAEECTGIAIVRAPPLMGTSFSGHNVLSVSEYVDPDVRGVALILEEFPANNLYMGVRVDNAGTAPIPVTGEETICCAISFDGRVARTFANAAKGIFNSSGTTVSGPQPVTVGARVPEGLSQLESGYVMEVLVFSRVLDESEINLLLAWANNKWKVF